MPNTPHRRYPTLRAELSRFRFPIPGERERRTDPFWEFVQRVAAQDDASSAPLCSGSTRILYRISHDTVVCFRSTRCVGHTPTSGSQRPEFTHLRGGPRRCTASVVATWRSSPGRPSLARLPKRHRHGERPRQVPRMLGHRQSLLQPTHLFD